MERRYVSQSAAVASYDYEDIAEGTGHVLFYGFSAELSGASSTYHLGKDAIYSNTPFTSAVVGGAAAASTLDLDFDTSPFNAPRIIEGDAYVSIPLAYVQNTSSGGEMFYYATISKWDGTTETVLVGPLCSETFSGATGADDQINRVITVKLTVPRTTFKVGDAVRLVIDLWCKSLDTPNDGWHCLGHDPKNRTNEVVGVGEPIPFADYSNTTQMILDLPFVLDI